MMLATWHGASKCELQVLPKFQLNFAAELPESIRSRSNAHRCSGVDASSCANDGMSFQRGLVSVAHASYILML